MQIIQGGQGPIFIQGGGIIVGQGQVVIGTPPMDVPPPPPVSGDRLELADGSVLHGAFIGIDGGALRFAAPDAQPVLEIQREQINAVRLWKNRMVDFHPDCLVLLANGDELYGRLNSFDGAHLGLATWFTNALSIPRAAVRSLSFLPKDFEITYDGISDTNGWLTSATAPNAPPLVNWHFRDGAFVCNGSGPLGRDVGLTNSSAIEFEMESDGVFQLGLSIYADARTNLENASSSYYFVVMPGQVILHPVHGGSRMDLLGTAVLPNKGSQGHWHFEIVTDRSDNSLAFYQDGLLVKKWVDTNGFAGNGSFLVFHEIYQGSVVKLSNLRVTHWQGRFDPVLAVAAPTNTADALNLVNRDRSVGKLTGYAGGRLQFDLGGRPIEIPRERVTRIDFAAAEPAPATAQMRATFAGGGVLSFDLDHWGAEELTGHSAVYGPLTIPARCARQLEFNLGRPRQEKDEFEQLDR